MIALGLSIPGAYSYGEPESILGITTHFAYAAGATAITAPLMYASMYETPNGLVILGSLFAILAGMINMRTLVKKRTSSITTSPGPSNTPINKGKSSSPSARPAQ